MLIYNLNWCDLPNADTIGTLKLLNAEKGEYLTREFFDSWYDDIYAKSIHANMIH